MACHALTFPFVPICSIGSVAKQFTAAAVVLAALEGKLELGDRVRRCVPELPVYGEEVTLDPPRPCASQPTTPAGHGAWPSTPPERPASRSPPRTDDPPSVGPHPLREGENTPPSGTHRTRFRKPAKLRQW